MTLRKSSFIGIAAILVCCIALFGCASNQSNQGEQEQVSQEEQAKIDKVNSLFSSYSGWLSLLGGEMKCTNVKDETATVKMTYDSNKMMETIKSFAGSMGANSSSLNSEDYQSQIDEMKKQVKDENYLKDSTKQSTKDIISNVDGIKSVNWIIVFDGEELGNYTQTEADVADVTASSTTTNEDGSTSVNLFSQSSSNDDVAKQQVKEYEKEGYTVTEETDTEYVLRKDGDDVGKYGNEITVYKDNGMTVGGKRK